MQINHSPRTIALPETGFVRQSQLLVFVPFSKSTLWRRVDDGTFPAPVKLSSNVTAWRAEDVRRWMADVVQPQRHHIDVLAGPEPYRSQRD